MFVFLVACLNLARARAQDGFFFIVLFYLQDIHIILCFFAALIYVLW